jgi:uncharacterized repeat protein (TIGR01451 family)
MRAILLLAAAALPALGQSPSAWAPVGVPVKAEPVIASSSKKTTLALPSDSRLPPPDDALPRLVTPPATPRRLPGGPLSGPSPIQPVSIIVPPPAVGLVVDVRAAERVPQGQPVPCTITVRNGGVPVADASIRLPLPEGARLISADPPAQRGPTYLLWDLGNLPAGAEQTLRAEVLPSGGGELSLRPIASYATAVAARTVIELPPVGVTITAPEAVTVGDGVTLKVLIKNNTPSTLRNVGITCVLPDGLVHAQGQRIVADLPGDLPPGRERTEELVVRAATAGAKAVALDARADGGLTAQARAVVEVRGPAVSLQAQGQRRARVGEEFSVRLLVANPGRSPVPPLGLFLALPEGVEFVSAGEGGAMHPAGGCVYWPVAALAAEGHQAVTVTLRGRTGGDWGLTAVASGEGVREVRHTLAVLVEQVPR